MKRRKHKWVQVGTFTCTEKQATQAHAPDGPPTVLTTDRVIAMWVQCEACSGDWRDVSGEWCPGTESLPVPGAN